MLQIAILAGGLATRLEHLTKTSPKSLLPLNGEPFLAHQLELLHRQGIRKVLLLVGHLGNLIRDFITRADLPDLEIGFSAEPEGRLLGTGGALKWAETSLDDDFFVMYGDSYLPINYGLVERFYFDSGKSPVMTVFRNNDRYDQSNVEIEGGKIVYYGKKEKRSLEYIDYGLMVLNKRCLSDFRKGEIFDLQSVLKSLVVRRQLLAYEVFERFWEIGSLSGIKELEEHLSGK